MMLRWLQKTGNKPIVLMGEAQQSWNPSGKNSATAISSEKNKFNKENIKKIFEKF